MKVNAVDRDKPLGRIEFRADEKGLTPYAGLAVTGQLARRLGLVALVDAELGGERRAAPGHDHATLPTSDHRNSPPLNG